MIQLTVEREPDAPVERKIELLRLRDDALEQTVEVLKMNHDRKLDDLTAPPSAPAAKAGQETTSLGRRGQQRQTAAPANGPPMPLPISGERPALHEPEMQATYRPAPSAGTAPTRARRALPWTDLVPRLGTAATSVMAGRRRDRAGQQ
jgi:hypothetical protein